MNHIIELDDYELRNLISMFKVNARSPMDNGDWFGQVIFKLAQSYEKTEDDGRVANNCMIIPKTHQEIINWVFQPIGVTNNV